MVLPAGSAAVVVGAVSTLLLMEGCGLLACAQASSAPGDASQPPAWMKSEYTGIGYFGELSLPITVTFASAAEAAALGLIDGDGERGPPQRPVLAITVFGNDLVGTFDIDESLNFIDMSPLGDSTWMPAGIVLPGIYQREGPRLLVALGTPAEDGGPPQRPVDFAAREGSIVAVLDPAADDVTCPALDAGDMPPISDMEPGVWRAMRPGGPTGCALGDDYVFFVRPGVGDAAKNVVIEFSGGGACWKASMCAWTPFAYLEDGMVEGVDCATFDAPGAIGRASDDNPTNGFTYVWLPYCTQDIHWGDAVVDYLSGDGGVPVHDADGDDDDKEGTLERFRHFGLRNARAALKYTFSQITDPDRVVVFGCSAGGYAATLFGGYVMAHYEGTGAHVAVIADSAAGVLTQSFASTALQWWASACALQGYANFLSAEDMARMTIDIRSLETVFVVMSQRFPDNVMATFSTVHDNNQRYFFEEMNADSGVPTTTTVQQREETWTRLMLHNMQRAAASAPNVRYWVEEGAGHCPSKSDAFYEWMYALIAHDDGEPLPASHACEGCSVDDIEGCDGVVGSGKVRNECGDCVDVDDFLSTSLACVEAAGIDAPSADMSRCTVDLDFFPPASYNDDQVIAGRRGGDDDAAGDDDAPVNASPASAVSFAAAAAAALACVALAA